MKVLDQLIFSFQNLNSNNIIICILLCYLFYSSYKDSEKFIIPQKVSLLFVILRFLVIPFYPISLTHILGGFIPFMLFWVIAAYLNQNMGGDIKFVGTVGLWIGLYPIFATVILSTIIILIVDSYYRMIKHCHYKIPYATFFLYSFIFLYVLVR